MGFNSAFKGLKWKLSISVRRGVDWINLAEDKEKRRALLNKVMALRVPYNARNFLTSSGPVSFQERRFFMKLVNSVSYLVNYRVLISPWPDREGNKLGRMSGTRATSTTSRSKLSSSFFPARQGAEGNSHHSERNISLFPSCSG